MLKNIFKILSVFIIGMVGGIFADQILWPYFIAPRFLDEKRGFYQYGLDRPPLNVIEVKEIYIQENIALENAIERVEEVVIGVRTETKAGKVLEGSGLILTSDGLIITLAELVPLGSEFNFFVNGERPPFQILKRDLEKNLALVKLEKINLPTVAFANLERLKLGGRVFLVGAVFEKDEVKKVVNEGIVAGLDKDSFASPSARLTSRPVLPGSAIKTNIFEKNTLAGSPLFDIEARILGLNVVGKDGRVSTIPVSSIRIFSGL